jgi:ABC-type multidrug transport system fused ATPase/permease subunit
LGKRTKTDKAKSPSVRLLAAAKPYRGWLILTAAVSIIIAACSILASVYLGKSTDYAVLGDKEQFLHAIFILVLVLGIDFPAAILKTYSAGRFSEYSLHDIRKETTRHIQGLPVSYLDKHPSADLLSRLNNDINLLQQFLQSSLADLIVQPVTFLAAAAFLFYVSFELSLLSFTAIPLFMVLVMLMSKPIEKYTKQQQEALSEVNVHSKDMIEGMEEAKAFQIEDTIGAKCNAAIKAALNKSLKVVFVQGVITPFNVVMQLLPFVLMFVYGGYLVIAGRLTFGELITYINLSNYVVNPLSQVPRAFAAYRTASAASARIFEIWDEPQERTDGAVFRLNDKEAAISFETVTYAYNESQDVIRDLSFEIAPGQIIALAGPSGCGKSTVLKLIAGFYSPQSGDIKVFGNSLKDWNLEALRKNISWVSQDTYLYPRSIYENIAYGKSDATEQEVIAAAKAAAIHDFIETLPDGYRTLVGERGAKLSGGQKQRIAIARALLKDAPILLLDEATSALDTESEQEVQLALEELMKGRTTLVVAHRLTTIQSATRILVMENGSLAEQGTHEELMKSGNLYRKLYYKQYAVSGDIRMEA